MIAYENALIAIHHWHTVKLSNALIGTFLWMLYKLKTYNPAFFRGKLTTGTLKDSDVDSVAGIPQ